MIKILVISVGGSAEPLLNAIKTNKPDYVYFFCSSGKRGSEIMVKGEGTGGKGLADTAGIEEFRYEIVKVDDPDDLNTCYFVLRDLAQQIYDKFKEGCHVIANYTGGTKTMSVAMALVGLTTEKWDLSVNVGRRVDLVKVRTGDVPVILDKWRIFCSAQIGFVKRTIEKFDYSHAIELIEEMLGYPLENELRRRLINARQICLALDSWDRFDHKEALVLLDGQGHLAKYIIALKRILGKTHSSGYEIVGDLLNNAERKSSRSQYDDAVARLYRAMELFAQARLKTTFNYNVGELRLEDLPEPLRGDYGAFIRGNGILLLGLREDYLLLNKLNDGIGREFRNRESTILSALTRRNLSICAHGLSPLNGDDFAYVKNILEGFITTVAAKNKLDISVPQLPRTGIL